ncbi:MAG TPA: hypothetical protein VGQ59_12025 [Cyclobacteriaceae bacterium]|jgi:hypothetical protein|nr:hypothetical protein [Cyclobacteriaceae bacterium]
MELHLKISGYCLIVLGMVHAIFPKQFNWKQELSSLSIMNRQMMQIHTFFIAFILVLVGVLCLTSSTDLVETALGKRISLGLGIFWIVRLFIQFFGYSSEIWRGKSFETIVHVLFSIFWTYLSVIFIMIYLR